MARKVWHLATILGLGVPMGMQVAKLTEGATMNAIGGNLCGMYTGYNPNSGDWKPSRLSRGLVPLAAGMAISMLAAKFGVNKFLPKGINL